LHLSGVHSWRYRRPKPFASWPGCISAVWGSYGVEESRKRGGECYAARMPSNGAGQDFIGAASGGRARVTRIYASPCSDAMARCAAGQSCHRCSYLAREARRR
jgi:hypothetical protein